MTIYEEYDDEDNHSEASTVDEDEDILFVSEWIEKFRIGRRNYQNYTPEKYFDENDINYIAYNLSKRLYQSTILIMNDYIEINYYDIKYNLNFEQSRWIIEALIT